MSEKTIELAKQAGFEVHPRFKCLTAPAENELIDGCYDVDDELEAFANLIRQDERESKWISVDDRLPEKDMEVLINAETDDGDYICSMRYDGKDFWHDGEQTFCHSWYCNPTHWMPLPKPPKAISEKG